MKLRRNAPLLLVLLAGCSDAPTSPELEASVFGLLSEPLRLEVGEVRTLEAAEAQLISLAGGAAGAEYTMVPFNGARAGLLALEVTGTGVVPVLGSSGAALSPSALRAAPFGAAVSQEPVRDYDFKAEIRRRERETLPRYLGALRAAHKGDGLRPSLSQTAAVPTVGSLDTINVSLEPCTGVQNRVGRVVAVSQRAVIVEDLANPAGGLTADDYRELGVVFDTLIWPVDTENFGVPTDIDNNGRVKIFYTTAVNALSKPRSDLLTLGFFFARDLFPSSDQPGFQGCTGSNEAEIFYMLAPDPDGTINENPRSVPFIRRTTVATIAHEFQHLILSARRLYVVNTNNFQEELWLSEGLAHIAEELVFYRASGLAPRQNIALPQIRGSQQVLDAFNLYAASNFGRFGVYLQEPETNSPYDASRRDNDLGTRGAIWAFLRYAADRRAGADVRLWLDLTNASTLGLATLRAGLGTEPIPLVRDWTTSVYTDDLLPEVSAAFRQPSWNFRSIYPAFQSFGGRYPLRTRTLTAGTPLALSLQGGSGAFVRFGVGAGERALVRTLSGGAAPPGIFSVQLVRTR
ncbi:MAG: hypothetical protein M3418_01770 [Gemmatimonadota bacterium]|nr:hypothetical protein [Gemmatimonadota bacterium]